ncbi:MAG: hypothetical protein EP329_20250 [Deltaproteobacteria bacterium]|nr:MAG: hypothetical protein EP329_20250 [Deltaproteobacteria bacterium]
MGRGRPTRTAPGALPSFLAALALLLSLGGVARAAEAAPTLDPAHTWTVIAGVLKWDLPELPSFSPHHRRDVALDALLAARGVPDAQRTLLLDEAATAKAVKAALKRAAAAARPGDTLIFYFDGHGILHEGREVIFATSDIQKRVRSGLHLTDLPPLFAGFRGARVILLADCCHSGGLQQVARALVAKGIDAVALTSATQSKVSTGNWTFTQALIDCLGGSALCDADADGRVTLDEVRGEASDTMLHREQQKIGWLDAKRLGGLVVATTRHDDPALEPGQARRGEWVVVGYRGRPRAARVLRERDGRLLVSVYDYADEVRLEVDATSVKALDLAQGWKVGDELDVAYEGSAYLARVEQVDGWLCYITYPGYGAEWNEWVGPDRIVRRHVPGSPVKYALGDGGAAPTSAPAPIHATSPTSGEVLIEWHGRWYPGVITGEKGGKRCVHYDGYDASWDECVTPDRLRPREP